MTDPHELDELASAHLDGATTAEEAARVAADPALRARVEQLRAVREAVAQVPTVDAAVRDQAIATALSALDEDDVPVGSVAPVTELTPRRGRSPKLARVVGAAAVVLLLALLVPVLSRVQDQDADEAASLDTGDDADEGGATAEDGGEELAPESAAGDDTAGGASERATLGTFDDMDELATALAEGALVDRPTELNTAYSGAYGQLCRPTPDGRTIPSRAVVAGAPVEVYLRTDPDGTNVMTVVARGSCELLDEREL